MLRELSRSNSRKILKILMLKIILNKVKNKQIIMFDTN